MKGTFGTTNNGNTPMAAILFCAVFSLLAFLGLCDPTFNQVSMRTSGKILYELIST
jgi:yeast amino acid transporter